MNTAFELAAKLHLYSAFNTTPKTQKILSLLRDDKVSVKAHEFKANCSTVRLTCWAFKFESRGLGLSKNRKENAEN